MNIKLGGIVGAFSVGIFLIVQFFRPGNELANHKTAMVLCDSVYKNKQQGIILAIRNKVKERYIISGDDALSIDAARMNEYCRSKVIAIDYTGSKSLLTSDIEVRYVQKISCDDITIWVAPKMGKSKYK
jgi:hypothetical protein